MPLVWTLHDQWAFCGAEHYTSPPLPGETWSNDERFAEFYSRASRPAHEAGPDLNRRTWLRKRRSWREPMQIVCPSNWLANCCRRSSLMENWPVTVIPYPLNLDTWTPANQQQARSLFNLPKDRPLVLFGAIGGTLDPRKGADLLLNALRILHAKVGGTNLEQLELVVFGQSEPHTPPEIGFPVHFCGRLHDDLSLRLLYAATDVMVVPSRQEAFGQTASEAHACGTPVVAFRTGGLVDIVDHKLTGVLAEPFDAGSLAEGIQWVLEDHERRGKLGRAARLKAIQQWEPGQIAKRYAELYKNQLHRSEC